jgi:YfiH family protein
MARLLFTSKNFGSLADSSSSKALPQLSELIGKPIQLMHQVHGDHVVVLHNISEIPTADALVTSNKEIALAVRVADCLPLLLYSENVVAAVHVGRKGLINKVAERAIDHMLNLGARQIQGVVGPHICGNCYEVGPDLYAQVTGAYPSTAGNGNCLNLYAGLVEQLPSISLTNLNLCTKELPDYFSYRANDEFDRQVGVISL